MGKMINIKVNGEWYEVMVKPQQTLLEVLRKKLGLTGTKESCGQGECNSCTVIVEGKAVPSCLVLAYQVDGKEILTAEGLAEGNNLHPLQKAFIDQGAIQCGFCTSGMLMTLKSFLDQETAIPSEEKIKNAISGNLCRCTGYVNIIEATKTAAEEIFSRRTSMQK